MSNQCEFGDDESNEEKDPLAQFHALIDTPRGDYKEACGHLARAILHMELAAKLLVDNATKKTSEKNS